MSLDAGSKQFIPCLQCFPDKPYQFLIDVEKRTFNCDIRAREYNYTCIAYGYNLTHVLIFFYDQPSSFNEVARSIFNV